MMMGSFDFGSILGLKKVHAQKSLRLRKPWGPSLQTGHDQRVLITNVDKQALINEFS